MGLGIIRWLQLLGTLAVVGPVALFGVNALLAGRLVGAVFLALAVGLLVLSEYVYTRFTKGTVGRARRFGGVRERVGGLRERLRR